MHPLAVRVIEVPGDVGPGRRSRFVLHLEDPAAVLIEHLGPAVPGHVPEPHRAVRPNPRVADRAAGCGNRREHFGFDVEPVQVVLSLDQVAQQQGRGVGPPVLDHHRSAERSQVEASALLGGQIPHGGAHLAGGLLDDGQPRVSRDRGPAAGLQGLAGVVQLCEHGARPRVDDAQRGVDQVAVFGMLQTEQRAVRGEGGAVEYDALRALGGAQPHGLGGAIQLLGGFAIEGGVDDEPVPVAHARRCDSRRLGQAFGPSEWQPVEQRLGGTALERLAEPPAGFVPGLVLEPQHAPPVERRRAAVHADRVVGDAAPGTGGAVPRVDLPHAALGGGQDQSVGEPRGRGTAVPRSGCPRWSWPPEPTKC